MDIHLSHIVPYPLKESIQNSVFKETEIQFKAGNFYVFSAPSGKGKTTLLSYIYGLRNDFSGRLMLGDRDVKGISAKERAELRQKKMAMVFQNLHLFQELSALDNIRLKNEICQTKSDEEIRAMAEQLGVADLLNQELSKLSMGQQQRIAIIRALCQPFEWLLLDEPFSHLDDANAAKAMEVMQSACRENGAGMILTSLGDHLNFETKELIRR